MNKIGKLDDTVDNRQKIIEIVRNKTNCYGINKYDYITFVLLENDYFGIECQWWAMVYMPTHIIRNCGMNQGNLEHRYWHSDNGIQIIQKNHMLPSNFHNLSMFQNFNAMRIYMNEYAYKTQDADIGLLLSDFMLSSDTQDWKEHPRTWNPPAWDDWMDGVHQTLLNINLKTSDPFTTKYNEKTAFLCMKNYLNLFYEQVPFKGVKNILQIINAVDIGSKNDTEWLHFLDCIQAAIDQEPNIVA